MTFLFEDVIITQRAFLKWVSKVFLQSSEGRSLPKDAKQQIYHITRPGIAISTTPMSLLPAIVDILEVWEAVPLVPETRQWAIARARFIARTLNSGLFQARLEEGLERDGTVSMFEPIRLPWHHKDLRWSPAPPDGGTFDTIIEPSIGKAGLDIKAAEADIDNSEALRISPPTPQQFIAMHGRTGSEVAAGLQVGQGTEAEADSPKRHCEPPRRICSNGEKPPSRRAKVE
ncbi:MAG: hypothetical protein Q9186_006364 [Xanthomendoza sp. 1 TL-2023]